MAGLGSYFTISKILLNKQQLAPVSPQLLILWPITRHSQSRFTPQLHLGISKASTSRSHLRLLYSSGKVALGKTQVGADLGPHHPGNPRASAPTGQLQTMSEHHPAPGQLILHGGQRLVISSHSQSLKLTVLCKSLPLICQ